MSKRKRDGIPPIVTMRRRMRRRAKFHRLVNSGNPSAMSKAADYYDFSPQEWRRLPRVTFGRRSTHGPAVPQS